jgi:hypothetical protein
MDCLALAVAVFFAAPPDLPDSVGDFAAGVFLVDIVVPAGVACDRLWQFVFPGLQAQDLKR